MSILSLGYTLGKPPEFEDMISQERSQRLNFQYLGIVKRDPESYFMDLELDMYPVILNMALVCSKLELFTYSRNWILAEQNTELGLKRESYAQGKRSSQRICTSLKEKLSRYLFPLRGRDLYRMALDLKGGGGETRDKRHAALQSIKLFAKHAVRTGLNVLKGEQTRGWGRKMLKQLSLRIRPDSKMIAKNVGRFLKESYSLNSGEVPKGDRPKARCTRKQLKNCLRKGIKKVGKFALDELINTSIDGHLPGNLYKLLSGDPNYETVYNNESLVISEESVGQVEKRLPNAMHVDQAMLELYAEVFAAAREVDFLLDGFTQLTLKRLPSTLFGPEILKKHLKTLQEAALHKGLILDVQNEYEVRALISGFPFKKY